MTAVAPRHALPVARPAPGLNHVLAYGQSLSSGWEGWPALSIAPRGDSLMLGRSVRPAHEAAPRWVPVGEPAPHPLAATMQDIATGRLLTADEVARMPPGSVALGETVLEAAVHACRAGLTTPDAVLLASSCGVGGRTLEALSRGATPELFNRLRDCVALGRQAASDSGRAYRLLAVLLLQGEQNAWALDGGTADRAAYRALLSRLRADIETDLAADSPPPAMFTYQTGGAYASDELGVAMAQLDAALHLPGCVMVGPAYPVSDKGGHLDANGYRWLGAQFGKVMHRVLTLGEAWRPLHPVHASLRGRHVRIEFHVPTLPLAWGRPFAGQRPAEVPDRGFSVVDGAGAVPVLDVALTGPDRVELTLGRSASGTAVLRYADRRRGGLGCLHDSDATVAQDVYACSPETAQDALTDLIGRPYPLMNWCVAFSVPLMRR